MNKKLLRFLILNNENFRVVIIYCSKKKIGDLVVEKHQHLHLCKI